MKSFPDVDGVYLGSWPVLMTGHLAVGPLAQPYDLDGFTEASFAGYEAYPGTLLGTITEADGYVFRFMQFRFTNRSGVRQNPTALYVTGEVSGTQSLLAVVRLPSNGMGEITDGETVVWDVLLSNWEYD